MDVSFGSPDWTVVKLGDRILTLGTIWNKSSLHHPNRWLSQGSRPEEEESEEEMCLQQSGTASDQPGLWIQRDKRGRLERAPLSAVVWRADQSSLRQRAALADGILGNVVMLLKLTGRLLLRESTEQRGHLFHTADVACGRQQTRVQPNAKSGLRKRRPDVARETSDVGLRWLLLRCWFIIIDSSPDRR